MPVRRLLPLLLAGVLGLAGGGLQSTAARAQSGQEAHVSTDLDGAVELARRALEMGRPDVAVSVARQILAQAPEDTRAHLILAAALTRTGAPGEAAPVARAGFRLAEGKEARFEAAYLTAEAMALSGRPLAAKYWLRRADLHAPTPRHEAVLAQAYRNVAARSRLSFSVALFGGPSKNVNGGSLHDYFYYYGIPIPVEQALPGQVWGGTVQLRYRLTPAIEAQLVWAHREVVLGDRARAIHPEARAADYRQDGLTFGLSHVWQDAEGRTAVLAGLSAGRRWRGGEVATDVARAELAVTRVLSPDWLVGGGLVLENAHVPGRPVADSQTRRLEFRVSHRAPRLGAVSLELGAVEVDSDAAGIAWRGPSLSLGWRPVLGTEALGLSLGLELERRDYWLSEGFDPDNRASLSATAELKRLERAGFTPTVTLSAARTRSDVVVRDTRELGVSFGLSSSF